MTDETPKRRNVGRGKPPEEYRWKKGQSGNPNGRPPKKAAAPLPSHWIESIIAAGLDKISIKQGGRSRNITGLEGSLMALRNRALQGHVPAIRYFMKLWKEGVYEYFDKEKRDLEILEQYKKYLLHHPSRKASPQELRELNKMLSGLRKEF